MEGPLLVEGKGVGRTIRMWEVRKLHHPVKIELPSAFGNLLPLDPPLSARIRLIQGKQIGAETHSAAILRINSTAVEIRSASVFPALASVQVQFPWEDQTGATLEGRICGDAGARDGEFFYAIRFGGMNWEDRAKLESLGQKKPVSGTPA